MGSIPKNSNKEIVRKIEQLLYYRRSTDATESQIAELLGFGSPEMMYRQFEQEGFPICEACGQMPAKEGHCKNNTPRKKRNAVPPRRGNEAKVRLPPASDTAELFLRALEKLRAGVQELKRRQEYLQDRRFVVKRGATLTWVHRRDSLPDSVWREICDRNDRDPIKTEIVEEPASIEVPGGGSGSPLAPLPALIAAYALSGEPLEKLVSSLRGPVEETDREALADALAVNQKKLELAADQLARLARGGEVKKGPLPEKVSWVEMWARKQIREGRRRGQTDEQIREFLRTNPELPELSKKRFSELANLVLP